MAMNVGSSGGGTRPDINVTPLVDVVLVLLIIFMVVTPLLEREMPMRLPEIEKDEPPPPPDQQPEENVVLYVTKDDEIKYNGTVLQFDEIEPKLGPVLRGKGPDGKDRVMFFAADDDAKYDFAIHVLDAARAAGAKVIGYLTETPEGAGGVPGGAPGTPAPPPGTPPPHKPGVR
jgi:biopolymer transport protein TolR